MLVATCVIKLSLDGVYSLKDKRSIVKFIVNRLPKQFNVATAEIDHHDVWQTAVIGLVTIGNDAGYLHGLLEKAVAWIEQSRPDAPIEAYSIEFR
ncbi:MAG: DUF503 domain-containing protein [Ardenticatenaceae bacterium]|nr:DUF503 domain-containing protein [Anaerolineales bacterium]MCB8922026.1 DUF503 domain-containing protein [Ardenticatenaceae bacterium]MCB8989602.1 DUF503 domain-containing protein [Ardenticatenaceae bacterium]MCB9003145.1 DUF503 domain-containing protein [Ardenticatenaceae bacterium]